jgi:serine/threonine-protein kinase
VGATMFRLLAKRRLHEASNEADLLVKMASVPAPPLVSVCPPESPVSVEIGMVVDRALELQREDRYPDAATMQRDVRALREGQPPPYATAVPVVRRRRTEPPAGGPALPTVSAGATVQGAPEPPAPLQAAGAEPAVTRPARAAPASAYPPGGALPTRSERTQAEGPVALAPPQATAPSDASVTTGASLPEAYGQTRLEPAARAQAQPWSTANAPRAIASPPPPPPPPIAEAPPAWPEADAPRTDRPPSERTLRSELGEPAPHGTVRLYGQRAPAAPATEVLPELAVVPVAAAPSLRPGATIPVVAPSPPVRKPVDPALVYLVVVGAAFAAIGVLVTLWLMLGRADTSSDPNATATATAPAATDATPSQEIGAHSPGHSHSSAPTAPRQPARPGAPGPLLAPVPQPPAAAPGHHHGH